MATYGWARFPRRFPCPGGVPPRIINRGEAMARQVPEPAPWTSRFCCTRSPVQAKTGIISPARRDLRPVPEEIAPRDLAGAFIGLLPLWGVPFC